MDEPTRIMTFDFIDQFGVHVPLTVDLSRIVMLYRLKRIRGEYEWRLALRDFQQTYVVDDADKNEREVQRLHHAWQNYAV